MKNFGPAVSGYLDPDGRNFEITVFQAGKLVLDKELNLSEELASPAGLARGLSPSGWMTNDPLNRSDTVPNLFTASATANRLVLANGLQALVNGWLLNVSYTGNSGANQLDMGAGPSGAGAKRTDIVVLEVWRRLLSPAPSTVGKSQTARIWRNGNVKIQSSDDAGLNFTDDLLDGTVNAETTKRVQIQYRLRVVQNVDLFAYPTGVDDPIVVANSVPASAAAGDGVATLFNYTNQSSNGDPGLWRAGDGDPTNTLGTVDGYMYAIPLVGVFRRNTTAWARNTNHNGGAGTPGPSTRPDGYLSDVFVAKDIADLRGAIALRGWENYQEIGEKNFQFLLDNVLKTEWGTTTLGGGSAGHTPLWADEIGVLPGDGVTTGDTPGAEFIGQFDCTRRFFSDRVIYEVLTFRVAPGDLEVSTPAWANGTVITINPATMAQYPFTGSFGFISRAPSGTRILDLVGARIEGTAGGQNNFDVGQIQATAPATTGLVAPIKTVTGLGVYPPGNVVITLGDIPDPALTTEPIYIDLLVAYPSGSGLTKTPTADFGSTSFQINNPGALPGSAPVSYAAMQNQTFDFPHREALLQYRTSTITFTFTAYKSITGATKYRMPERVHALSQVRVNGSPLPGVGGTVDATGTLLTLVGGTTSPGDVVDVDFVALRPMPQSGVQMTVFYETRVAQTVRTGLLGTSLTLIPRWISPFLYSITAGSGSAGEAYPYPYAYVQTGGVLKASGVFGGEHELDGAPEIFVAEFNATTGMLRVPAFIPYTPNPESVTLTRSGSDADIEDRTFFPAVPGGYKPNAFGQNLSDERIHKVVMPAVMELSADGTLGRKGTLFLVLFVRWAEFDAENSIKFLASNNSTVASVFRLSGNLLNRRA